MNKSLVVASLIAIITAGCKKDHENGNPLPVDPQKITVTTIAGTALNSGNIDGPALSAKFAYPEDIAIANGIMYITDFFNGRIRRNVNGQVTTFAGSNSNLGINDGHGDAASFIYPSRAALDVNGNLFTLDGVDPRIRKTTSSSDVITFAGTASLGFKDGALKDASFNPGIGGITINNHNDVYISDSRNHSIRRINSEGIVETFAGNGHPGYNNDKSTNAQFNAPSGIVADENGNIYVADQGNFRIRKITADGTVSFFSGSGVKGNTDGNARTAQFSNLIDMVIDKKGNLFVTDDHRIREITAAGTVITIAGSDAGYADGNGSIAKFYFPTGLGIDEDDNLYVADTFNHCIRKLTRK